MNREKKFQHTERNVCKMYPTIKKSFFYTTAFEMDFDSLLPKSQINMEERHMLSGVM